MNTREPDESIQVSPNHLVVGRQNGITRLVIPYGLTTAPQPGASFADMWVSTITQMAGANARPGSITLTAAPGLPDEMIDILTERFGPDVMDEIDRVLASETREATIEIGERQLRELASTISLKFDI